MSFTYNINLSVFGTSALDSVITRLDKLESKLSHASQVVFSTARNVKSGFANMQSSVSALDSKVDETRSSILAMGSASRRAEGQMKSSFGGMGGSLSSLMAQVGATAFAINSLRTTADIDSLERSIVFAGGSEGAANLKFVNETARAMKMDVQSALEGFKSLSGSMVGTNITAQQTRDIFRATGVASKVMGLSADDTKLAFLALGQMASKGVISMEELRQQLGERLPGAFAMGARSLNVTTAAFNKLVGEGKITAEKFLPGFAAEMEKTFGPGMANAMDGPASMFAEFNTALMDTKVIIGTELMPHAISFVRDFLQPSVKWLGENIEKVKSLTVVIGSFWAATKVASIVGMVSTALGSAATITGIGAAIGGTSSAVLGLNAAMTATPWGLWIAAIAAASIGLKELHDNDTSGLIKGKLGGRFGGYRKEEERKKQVQNKFLSSEFNDWAPKNNNGVLTDHVGNFLSGIGLSSSKSLGPLAGGMQVFDNSPLPGSAAAKSLADAASKGINGINEGGRHSKVINISLGNMVEKLEINAATAEKGMDDMVEMLTRKLTQIINNANQVQTTF